MNTKPIPILTPPEAAAYRDAMVKQGLEAFYETVKERDAALATAERQAREIAHLHGANLLLSGQVDRLMTSNATLQQALGAASAHLRNNRSAFADVSKETERALASVREVNDGAAELAAKLSPQRPAESAAPGPAPNIAKLTAA